MTNLLNIIHAVVSIDYCINNNDNDNNINIRVSKMTGVTV